MRTHCSAVLSSSPSPSSESDSSTSAAPGMTVVRAAHAPPPPPAAPPSSRHPPALFLSRTPPARDLLAARRERLVLALQLEPRRHEDDAGLPRQLLDRLAAGGVIGPQILQPRLERLALGACGGEVGRELGRRRQPRSRVVEVGVDIKGFAVVHRVTRAGVAELRKTCLASSRAPINLHRNRHRSSSRDTHRLPHSLSLTSHGTLSITLVLPTNHKPHPAPTHTMVSTRTPFTAQLSPRRPPLSSSSGRSPSALPRPRPSTPQRTDRPSRCTRYG